MSTKTVKKDTYDQLSSIASPITKFYLNFFGEDEGFTSLSDNNNNNNHNNNNNNNQPKLFPLTIDDLNHKGKNRSPPSDSNSDINNNNSNSTTQYSTPQPKRKRQIQDEDIEER